jgi:glycosyltransferase involved in cell wall biosynthesis
MSALLLRVKRSLARATRWALLRRVRVQPSAAEQAGAERRVFIVLMTAFGMGGTIRTCMNLAGYLASSGYEVTIISVKRTREKPFFEWPEGVRVVSLDLTIGDSQPSWLHPIRRVLLNRSSVLMHPGDRGFRAFSLWADWRLVRTLRGRAGFLITTRPGLNLLATELTPPGLVLIGQEHMHLREHSEVLQEAMRRRYRKLASLAVLTARDRWRYKQHLEQRTKVVLVPNTVRDMGGVRADLSAKTVLAAGRFARQKGYDRLVKTWPQVAEKHPDWRLRICGAGPGRAKLERLIAERGLEDVITLAKPAEDMGAEMAKASMFVLSSRWEGLPLVLLEAMSVGMGVVSFNCPTGPADVIEDHVNGLLIKPRTIDALAAGLNEMIEDEDLRRRCAAAAIETAGDYSMDVIGPRWEAVLREAWERRGPNSPKRRAQRAPTTSSE